MSRVLGVDACARGWVGVALDEANATARCAPDIAGLVAEAERDGPLTVVAVDMPLGLSDDGPREADVLARRLVGARASSVFATPSRPALRAGTRAEADAVQRALTGGGVSAQAFALRRRLFEVEAFARRCPRRVVEVHPEVSFARMAGGPLEAKRTWNGVQQRQRALAHSGVVLPADLGPAVRAAAVDDVLDAAAAAWTARRVEAGTAVSYPDPPVSYADGWPCAIWV